MLLANFKVFMTDTIFPDSVIEEEELAKIGAQLQISSDKTSSAFITEGHDCDAMLVVYAPVGEEVIRKLDKCRIIVRTGIGVNNIDVDAATEKKIMVCNVPDYCIEEVADHTIALFLSGIRKVSYLNQKVKGGQWDVTLAKPVPRLRGKKYGVLGCGAIGREVATRAQAFGMDIYGYDPYLSDERLSSLGITRVASIEEIFSTVDFFSLHMPLTEETHHLINESTLSLMKPSTFFVNTSRGPLVNQKDLYQALVEKRIAGAALDVLETEPPEAPFALAGLDNIILTPHAAFYSDESEIELRRKAALEIVRALTGNNPKNWVNKF